MRCDQSFKIYDIGISCIRKHMIAILCLLLALMVAGCEQKGETAISNAPQPDYDVEWSTGVSYLKTSSVPVPYAELTLRITARHNFTDMYVIVSDPDGHTIGKKLIPKEDLFDGLEIVKLQMAPPKTTPMSGSYTAVLAASSRELIYKEDHTFDGPNITINFTNLGFVDYISNEGVINYVNFLIINKGDLPTFVYDVSVAIFQKDTKECLLKWHLKPDGGVDFLKDVPQPLGTIHLGFSLSEKSPGSGSFSFLKVHGLDKGEYELYGDVLTDKGDWKFEGTLVVKESSAFVENLKITKEK